MKLKITQLKQIIREELIAKFGDELKETRMLKEADEDGTAEGANCDNCGNGTYQKSQPHDPTNHDLACNTCNMSWDLTQSSDYELKDAGPIGRITLKNGIKNS
jgi:hypothetical protein